MVRAYWKTLTMSDISGWDVSLTGGYDPVAEYVCSHCSNCALANYEGEEVLSAYCPFCGAKMDGYEE